MTNKIILSELADAMADRRNFIVKMRNKYKREDWNAVAAQDELEEFEAYLEAIRKFWKLDDWLWVEDYMLSCFESTDAFMEAFATKVFAKYD